MTTFISYSRANSDFAVRLAKDLKSAGLDIWLDQLDIPTGARWDDEIEKALEKSAIFLIILSPESIESQNVKDEVGYAIDAGKYILPVVTRQCRIPFRLRRFQFVDFSNKPYEDSLAEIKYLLSNTKKLASAGTTQEDDGNFELPPSRLEPNTQGKNMQRAEQTSSKRSEPPKKNRAGSWALIFLGFCAVVIVGFIALMVTSPTLMNLIRPASSTPLVIITTAAPTETPTAPAIATTAVPTTTPITPTVQLNLCDQVADKSLKIQMANGFQGVIGPSGIPLIAKGSANFVFTTVAAYPNEQVDAVSGSCVGNTIKFTRTRPKAFIQDYQATISSSSNGNLTLNGSFTDRASGQKISLTGDVSQAVTAMGLCDQLAGKSINIKQVNGFQGVIGPSGIILIAKGDGTYSISTEAVYGNEPADPVLGNCQRNTLTFTRTRANVFTQDFQAAISQNAGILSLEGSVTGRETGEKVNWSGQVTEANH